MWRRRHTQHKAGHCLHCLSSPAAFPPHQDCWVRAHFCWFCHHPWGSKFNFVCTSGKVCASAEWADNRCRLFSALAVVLQFCVTFEPSVGGVFKTEARCNLVFPVVGNADVSKLGFLFDSEPAKLLWNFPWNTSSHEMSSLKFPHASTSSAFMRYLNSLKI